MKPRRFKNADANTAATDIVSAENLAGFLLSSASFDTELQLLLLTVVEDKILFLLLLRDGGNGSDDDPPPPPVRRCLVVKSDIIRVE